LGDQLKVHAKDYNSKANNGRKHSPRPPQPAKPFIPNVALKTSPPEPNAPQSAGEYLMMVKINQVPGKFSETEKPTVIAETTDPEKEAKEKLERSADRAAHKANKTEQQYDEDHNTFTI
jgi:hypothetical protein